MSRFLFLVVSDDEYELPIMVADSAIELSRRLGLNRSAVCSAISKAEKLGTKSKYKKVEVEDFE